MSPLWGRPSLSSSFLSAGCLGCQDLWDGTEELRGSFPEGVRIVIVAKGPEDEDAGAIASLAPPGPPW